MAYGFRRPRSLRLEALGERALPSVTWADDGAGEVTITGDQRGNTITITDNGSGGFTVQADDWSQDFDNSVTSLVIKTAGGVDDVTYNLGEGVTDAVTRTVEVRLGNRNDSFTADLSDLPADSDLSLTVYGGNGHDTLGVTGGGAAGNLTLALFGGNGKDLLSAEFAGALGGNSDLTLDGGNGKDDVSASLSVDAPADGSTETPTVAVHVLGGNGKDDLTLTVDGEGASSLTDPVFEINGGRGRDTFDWTADVVTVLDAEAKA
ncbi:MAG TPA: hypothetical protein VKD90_03400 [Gemmataceae bacterium]|nr:hypothetical protein [Gemmataceae bacterium]